MPVEVKVGPPVLTINQGTMFMVTDQRGEIESDSELGFFADDTRLISFYRVFMNGQPWELLTSAEVSYYAVRIALVNPQVISESGEINAHDVGSRSRGPWGRASMKTSISCPMPPLPCGLCSKSLSDRISQTCSK